MNAIFDGQRLASFCSDVRQHPFDATRDVVAYLDLQKQYAGSRWTTAATQFRDYPLHGLLLEDPYTQRAFRKPRGYAGDAVMMDFLYGHPSVADMVDGASDIGRRICRFSACDSDPARAVRWRRRRVAVEIEAMVEARGHIEVFAFASGHLREFELLPPDIRGRVRFVAADADEVSLAGIGTSYGRKAVECSHTSIKQLLMGRARKLGKFDFAYTLGLLDYVTGRAAGRVVECLWDLIRPSGAVLAANFTRATRGSAYMEAAMDWWLQYRSRDEVSEWARSLYGLNACEVFEDPYQQIAYLLARKG
jgi:hypothetical protein